MSWSRAIALATRIRHPRLLRRGNDDPPREEPAHTSHAARRAAAPLLLRDVAASRAPHIGVANCRVHMPRVLELVRDGRIRPGLVTSGQRRRLAGFARQDDLNSTPAIREWPGQLFLAFRGKMEPV